MPGGGGPCLWGCSIISTLPWKTNQHSGIPFPSARFSDIAPELWMLLLIFIPWRTEGKASLAQPAAEAPTQPVPGAAGVSKQDQLPPSWCICCTPPGTGEALRFSKPPPENATTAVRSASCLSNQSNPFLPKFSQVAALGGCFSTASPLLPSACVQVQQICRAGFNVLPCDSACWGCPVA